MATNMPLSPRSPASLNRRSMSPVKDAKSPSPGKSEPRQLSAANSRRSRSSSPFQTEVSGTITLKSPLAKIDNVSTHTGSPLISPLDSNVSTSKFEIHVDDEDKIENNPTTSLVFTSSSELKSSARPDTTTSLSPLEQARSPSKPTSRTAGATANPPTGDDTLRCMREEIFHSQFKQSTSTAHENNHEINDDDFDTRSTTSEDTCFSTFSAVPNADMTMFANLKPDNGNNDDDTIRSPQRKKDPSQTPGKAVFYTPGTSRRNHNPSTSRSNSPSPTPRHASRDGDTTSLLLDFTQQFREQSRSSPTKRGLSPTKTEPNLLSYINNQRMPSPTKATTARRQSVLNLLDFDLPPQPTPRSIPSITVRELESLKSSYLSEISSLKATLSGKEAEVESLKKAVSDAERRVGESLENLQEERNAKEHAEKEKADWEQKGQEIECVLRSVREEFLQVEKEKEELQQKLEESNQAREEAELNAAAALTKASLAQCDATESTETQESGYESLIEQRVAQQLDEKMENLARELHAVYKKKHETKVATLKKTYETRSDKKCRDLQLQIDELSKQNDELQATKDASFSDELPTSTITTAPKQEELQQLEAQKTELEECKAKLAGLTEEVRSVRSSHTQLLQELETERVEKGELVAAVDEMLSLQAEVGAPSAVEDFRKSIGRPSHSGLKGPGFGASASSGGSTSKLAVPGKSRMMMGIERMGSSRAAS